jgi:hypothetical protein
VNTNRLSVLGGTDRCIATIAWLVNYRYYDARLALHILI